jgi:hypothetical protein
MRFSSRWAILSVAQSSWALVIGCRTAVFVIRRQQSRRRRPRAFTQTDLISGIHPLSEASTASEPPLRLQNFQKFNPGVGPVLYRWC